MFKKYKQQRNQTKKLKRTSYDTTIPNMLGYNSTTNSKDYGKVKPKRGLKGYKTVTNNYPKNK